MNLTDHAAVRMQQRCIPPLVVDLLYEFGREEQQDGATVLVLDARGRQQALQALRDALSRFDKLKGAYLVEAAGSGRVLTVGHRTRRIRRK